MLKWDNAQLFFQGLVNFSGDKVKVNFYFTLFRRALSRFFRSSFLYKRAFFCKLVGVPTLGDFRQSTVL